MGGEGGPTRTSLVRTGFDGRTTEPTVGEFMVGWWLLRGFVVGGGGVVVGGDVVGVEFFAVHVGMGADAASLYESEFECIKSCVPKRGKESCNKINTNSVSNHQLNHREKQIYKVPQLFFCNK